MRWTCPYTIIVIMRRDCTASNNVMEKLAKKINGSSLKLYHERMNAKEIVAQWSTGVLVVLQRWRYSNTD